MRPFQWYHSHVDPIWSDGTFKFSKTSLLFVKVKAIMCRCQTVFCSVFPSSFWMGPSRSDFPYKWLRNSPCNKQFPSPVLESIQVSWKNSGYMHANLSVSLSANKPTTYLYCTVLGSNFYFVHCQLPPNLFYENCYLIQLDLDCSTRKTCK